jgi:hypothetical protein
MQFGFANNPEKKYNQRRGAIPRPKKWKTCYCVNSWRIPCLLVREGLVLNKLPQFAKLPPRLCVIPAARRPWAADADATKTNGV